jgi:cytochrome c556
MSEISREPLPGDRIQLNGLETGRELINGREKQMIRTLRAIVVAGLAVSVATAQQNPIAARKALMKNNGDQAKIGAAMAKGAPFDLAIAHKIFATFEDTAVKAPALFQEKSVGEATADDPYTANPKISKYMDDFLPSLAATRRPPPLA